MYCKFINSDEYLTAPYYIRPIQHPNQGNRITYLCQV